MIATSVVLQNVAYIVGAVIVIAVLILAVSIRHHKPQSSEDYMDTFHRGLRALSPTAEPAHHRRRQLPPAPQTTTRAPAVRAIHLLLPSDPESDGSSSAPSSASPSPSSTSSAAEAEAEAEAPSPRDETMGASARPERPDTDSTTLEAETG